MDKKKIVPAFAPFFKEHGYKKWGATKFYKIENDIAFCFLFERPSIVVYPRYFFLPLYMPMDFVHVSFGDRFYLILDEPTYCIEDDDSTFEPWVERVKGAIENFVFPFYGSINTIEKMLDFLERPLPLPPGSMGSVGCKGNEFIRLELQTYTSLFLGNEVLASKYTSRLREESTNGRWKYPYYTNSLFEGYETTANQLDELIKSPKEAQEAFFRDTIRYNKEKYFHIKPKE